MKLDEVKKILNEHGYLVESKVATKEDFDNLFKVHGFEKTKGEFDWEKTIVRLFILSLTLPFIMMMRNVMN